MPCDKDVVCQNSFRPILTITGAVCIGIHMKRVNFHLTDAQIEGLRSISAKTGVPVAEIVRRIIDAHLTKVKKK
jgi:hypothetical protein